MSDIVRIQAALSCACNSDPQQDFHLTCPVGPNPSIPDREVDEECSASGGSHGFAMGPDGVVRCIYCFATR
jgi:hypothetical protein